MRSIYGLLDLNVLRWSINRLLMQRTEESQGKHCEDNTPLRAGFQPCGARSAAAPGADSLQEAKARHDQLERLYGDAVDSSARQALCDQAMKYLE